MNSSITFPAPTPALNLVRPSAEKWAASLADERRRLEEDLDALREREKNLRDYETRLRVLQAEIEAGRGGVAPAPVASAPAPAANRSSTVPFARPGSRAPFGDEAALQAGWEKLHRAREILEAEQNHLRVDRMTIREQEAAVKRREQAVAEREMQVAAWEARTQTAGPAAEPEEPVASEHTMSAVTRLTRAPFNLARTMLSGKR
jgi:hypothetical protein